MKRLIWGWGWAVSLVVAGVVCSSGVQAGTVTYYVGADGRSTPFNAPDADGGGAYPANPNHRRLTLLRYHGDHFHGIGAYAYTGPAATPQLKDTNANNRLPETYTGFPPISLLPGTGDWAGTFRTGMPSGQAQDVEYGNWEIRNVHSLAVDDPITYNSSGGRWNSPFADAHIHLELVSLSPGLHVAFGDTPSSDLTQPGDDWHLGDGDEMFSLTPTFWVDDAAPLGGTYSAEFRLTNTRSSSTDSGRFYVDLQVVPEPATSTLAAVALLGLVGYRRARQSPLN